MYLFWKFWFSNFEFDESDEEEVHIVNSMKGEVFKLMDCQNTTFDGLSALTYCFDFWNEIESLVNFGFLRNIFGAFERLVIIDPDS